MADEAPPWSLFASYAAGHVLQTRVRLAPPVRGALSRRRHAERFRAAADAQATRGPLPTLVKPANAANQDAEPAPAGRGSTRYAVRAAGRHVRRAGVLRATGA